MRGEQLKGHLDLLVMAVVRTAPAHGYAIIAALRERSNGVFELPEGTLYPVLHRLEKAALLESRWEQVAGRRRRIYALTVRGEAALGESRAEWTRFSRSVGAIVGAPA